MDKTINVNIWDDYHDDGFIPEGEIQETYAYIESAVSDEDSKNILELLQKNIQEFSNTKGTLEFHLHYYDSAKKYPNLVGTEHEYCLYKRWELAIKHLSHQSREQLVATLENQGLTYLGTPLTIYSES